MTILAERVHRIAAAGRLRVSEERAVNLIRSAGVGTVHTLLTLPPEQSDTDEPAVPTQDPAAFVAAFRTLLPELPTLSKAEAALLDEWLQR